MTTPLTRRAALGAATLATAALTIRPARADGRAALYQATAIVTGSDERSRPAGFASCLREVVGKLTGDVAAADGPAIAALAAHAADLVASYDYLDPRAALLHHDDQGTSDRSYELTVRFDRPKTDAAISALGLRLWTAPRPLLCPVILVHDRDPTPYFLTDTAPRGADMRTALLRATAECGIGLRLPTNRDLAAWALTPLGTPTPLGDPPPGLARPTGTLSWDVHAMGWIGAWHMEWQDTERSWRRSGVSVDDALGDLVRGSVTVLSQAALAQSPERGK